MQHAAICVHRHPRLCATMLRWRASMTLVLFMLCAAAWHGLSTVTPTLALAGFAVASLYASLVSMNDLADEAIDRENLRGFRDRPLVTSGASRRELMVVAGITAVVGIAAAFIASPIIGVLDLAALLLYAQYSLPPLRVSHQPWLAAPYLALGYAAVPYVAGVIAVGGRLGAGDALPATAAVLLFLSRSLLKDLRDRWGDAAHGKRTLVLMHGKPLVWGLSVAAMVLGLALLAVALLPLAPAAAVALVPFAAAMGVLQVGILRTSVLRDEVMQVLLLARISNGVLVTVLSLMLVQRAGLGISGVIADALVVPSGYLMLLLRYLRRPAIFRLADEEALRPALCAVNPPSERPAGAAACLDATAGAVHSARVA
jgi:4-hydroxybenzoate polyprenyltransferase